MTSVMTSKKRLKTWNAIVSLLLFIAFLASFSNPTVAAEPLVDNAWVSANAGKEDVVFLDIRGGMRSYLVAHIPGAIHTDYSSGGWREDRGSVKGLLPDPRKLEKLIGRLGISNDTHVVIVPGGYSAGEVASATRIYWTFKVLGHNEVSILNGGMEGYLSNKNNPIEHGAKKPVPKTFEARLQRRLLAMESDVQTALKNKTPLIDIRPSDQFLGINKSIHVKQRGTIPGAKNLPGPWLTNDNGGTFRNKDILETLLAASGAPAKGPAITFCNTGHWASIGWFVLHEIIGNKQTRLYDGSMAQWTQDPKNPVKHWVDVP
jgi:thiosulfate/3-mercaptopyruvate sulfurtransferase